MTFEDALGRPIADLEDATLAHIMFPLVKHGNDDPESRAEELLNAMSNKELLSHISMGLETLLSQRPS